MMVFKSWLKKRHNVTSWGGAYLNQPTQLAFSLNQRRHWLMVHRFFWQTYVRRRILVIRGGAYAQFWMDRIMSQAAINMRADEGGIRAMQTDHARRLRSWRAFIMEEFIENYSGEWGRSNKNKNIYIGLPLIPQQLHLLISSGRDL